MRRKSKKIKNFILKTVTGIALLIFFISAAALDNGSWIPTIMLVISGAWLTVFGLANGWFEVDKPERWDL